MATLSSPIPSPNSPIADPATGLITQEWWFVIQRLFQRTGGTTGAGFMPTSGGTFTGPVVMGANVLSGSAIDFIGGTLDGTPIGGSSPSSGKFTTLSATSTISGAGFTAWAASPPAIGATTPAAGAFTTLSATSTVSGAGFTAWAASPPAIGGTAAAAGSFTTLAASSTITPSQTAGIVGTTTNNNANAGSVGEYLTASAAGVSLTTATITQITSLSLTAGDWDVWGFFNFAPAATTTVSQLSGFVNTVNNAFPSANTTGAYFFEQASFTTGGNQVKPTGTQRISIASTTTFFLCAFAGFGVSTMTASGTISARRVR